MTRYMTVFKQDLGSSMTVTGTPALFSTIWTEVYHAEFVTRTGRWNRPEVKNLCRLCNTQVLYVAILLQSVGEV